MSRGQTWAHYECIGEGEDGIVGIWTCIACRKMPTMVMELIGRVAKLQESVFEMRDTNAQLVGMLSDQQSELHRLREDFNERLPVDTANTHAETTIDSPPKPTTLCPRHTECAVPLRCLYDINRSGTAMIAVVPQWFHH